MKNTDRAAKVMHEHNLFYFTSGDGWHEPREESAECRCGAEFFDQIQPYIDERDPDALYRAHLAEAMNKDGCLMPDLPEPDSKTGGVWETGDIDIAAEDNGAVTIEYVDDYEGDIWGSQTTRSVGLTRAQVLAVLAASEWNPNDQH